MRAKILWSLVAVLGAAGCVTAGSVGRCPKVAATAKAKHGTAPTPKASATAVTSKPATAATAARSKPPASRPAEAGRWPSFATALARAKATGRPLLLEVSTAWCTACKQFEKDIEPDPEVMWLLARTEFVRYDAEHGPGVGLATRFGVSGYPTFLLFDGAGHLVYAHPGSEPLPRDFADDLGRALAGLLTPETAARLGAGHPPPAARRVLAWYAIREGHPRVARRQLEAAIHTPKVDPEIAARALAQETSLDLGRVVATTIRDAYVRILDRYPSTGAAATVMYRLFKVADPTGKVVHQALLRFARRCGRASSLNNLVYEALGSGLPDVAVAAARRQVAIHPADPNAYDTLADALHGARQDKAAVAALAKAVALAEAQGAPASQMNDLRKHQAGLRAEPLTAGGRKWAAEERADRLTLVAAGPADLLGALRPPPLPSPPSVAKRFRIDLSLHLRAAGEACAVDRGHLQSAWVRLRLKGGGGAPSRVRVLEPGASKALRQCLVGALSQMRFAAEGAPKGSLLKITKAVPLVF